MWNNVFLIRFCEEMFRSIKKDIRLMRILETHILIILYIDGLLLTILSLLFLFNSEFTFSILWLIMVCISWYLFGIIVEDINKE